MIGAVIRPVDAAVLARLIGFGVQAAARSGLEVDRAMVAGYLAELESLALWHAALRADERRVVDARVPRGFLTASETAARFGVTARAVTGWCRAGRLPGAVRLGKAWLIPAAALQHIETQEESRER